MGKTEKPYADADSLISDAPNEVQSMIIDIYQISQKYNSRDQMKGNESFEESLCNMSNSLDEMISRTLMNLTYELDYGKTNIAKYRASLGNAQSSLLDTNFGPDKSKKISFFNNYCSSLFEKESLINESIRTLNLQTNQETMSSFENRNNINLLLSMCDEQHDAIIRCSSRLYAINENMELIRKKLRSYSLNFKPKAFDKRYSDNDDNEISSSAQKLIFHYQTFTEERKRNLEKRNLDRSLFTKDTGKKNSGFSFGTGNRFGIVKANYGANNAFSTGYSGNTNTSTYSKQQDKVLSTPKKNYSSKQLSPVFTGFQEGKLEPSAPKVKGGSIGRVILDDPP